MTSHERVQAIAALHLAALGEGFLAQLGPKFLALLYAAMDRADGVILITEERDGHLTGFVSGGEGMGVVYRALLRRPVALALALAPVLLSPHRVLRIIELMSHSARSTDTNAPRAELFSIAVSPTQQRTGTASRLYAQLADAFRRRGISAFRIVVGDELAPAQAFYRRMGAVPVAAVSVHSGQLSTLFVQDITIL